MTRIEFIDKMWIEAAKAKKLGAPISVPIVVAQAALESNWGVSELSASCNNYFGIKGEYRGESCEFKTIEQDSKGNERIVTANFRHYPTVRDCFLDYGSIIRRLSWYQDAEDAAHSPKDYLRGLEVMRDDVGNVTEPGWATDTGYFDKVWSIVQQYNLLERSEEVQNGTEFVLVQVYENGRRYDYYPLKTTVGTTKDGHPKLMIRIKPKSFLTRLKEFFLGSENQTTKQPDS